MASKKDIDLSSNMDDFGDFDFDVDESGVPANKVAQPSKMRSDYIPAMTNGFLSGLKKELASKFPETAAFVGELNSAFDQVKSMTSNFSQEATPMVRSMGRSMNRLMPLVKPFMPNRAYNWVTGKLSSIPEDQSEMSEEERMGQQISADINAALQGADASAGARDQMNNIVGGMRHKATMGGIYTLGKQMNTVTTFLTTTMTAYMKKDLELQYRQLYAQRDIASTLRATAKLIEVELKHITHNTGLPESVKAEAVKKRGKFAQSAREFAYNRLSTFLKNVKEQIFDQVKESISMIGDALSGGADMAEMMQDMGEDLSLKNLAIKGAIGWLGGKAGGKVGEKLAPYLKAIGGGGLEGATKFGMEKLFEWIRGKAEQDKLGPLSDIFLNADPGRFKPELKISNLAAKDPNKPVAFDISTRDAIVNVIPSWLSKIHAVTMDIKDPTKQHEELMYDPLSRGFISVNDNKSEMAKDLRAQFQDILKPSYDHKAVFGAMAAARASKTGRDMSQILNTILRPENQEQLNILFQNIADNQNGFHPDWLDKACNLPSEATGEESSYYDSAIVGLKNPKHVVRLLLGLLGGVTKDTWDQEMFNMVDNNIRQIRLDNDPTKLKNKLEDIFNNGTEAQKKMAIKILNEGIENPDDYIATEKGVNLANFEKFMAKKMSEDNGNTYSMVRAATNRKLAELQKVNPKATEQDLYKQDPAFKAWVDEVRKTESYQSTYEASVADELYGKDFFKVFFVESGELYNYYKTNRELLLFDTIIASNSPMQSEAHQEAAKVFLGWYELGSKAKDEVEVRAITTDAYVKLGDSSFFSKIAQPIFTRYSTPKSIKEIYEGIKPEGDKKVSFPGLNDRIKVIKNNDGLRRMYGDSIENVVRRNTKSKTRKKGENNTLGKAASSLAGAVAHHFGPIGGMVLSAGKWVWDRLSGTAKEKYDEYKAGGIGNISIGDTTLKEYKDAAEAVLKLSDEEFAKQEWKDPTPEEIEERIQGYLKSQKFLDKNKGKSEEELKALAAEQVKKDIEKEHKAFDERKQKVLKAIEKAKRAKEKGGSLFNKVTSKVSSWVTGKPNLQEAPTTKPYVAPTEEERNARIAEKAMTYSDDIAMTPAERQAQAAKEVDEEIAKEKAEYEAKQAKIEEKLKAVTDPKVRAKIQEFINRSGLSVDEIEELEIEKISASETTEEPKKSLVERAKDAFDVTRSTIRNGIDNFNGVSAERDVIADNVAKIYALLEKKFGSLTEEEIKKVETKMDEDKEKAQEKRVKKGGGFFKSLGGAIGGALSSLNPFKATPAAIAAKYRLDASAVESAFHGDFQRYFEYRKEMDTYIASHVAKGGTLSNIIRGVGSATGGIARGLGSAASGAYHMLGGVLPAGIRGLGTVLGGMYHGAGAAIGGIASGVGHVGSVVLPASWNALKKTVKAPFKIGKKLLGIGRQKEDNERYYNLYRKDKLGTPGWEADPILSVQRQEDGVYDDATNGRIEKTDDITGPVYYWETIPKPRKHYLIYKEDWDIGIVNAEGKSISDKAKEHEKSGALINIRTGGLFGGLFKGLGSLGGGIASAISDIIGFDIKAIGGIGGFITKTIGGIGRGIGNFLGLGNSEKAQQKKYKLILGKFDEQIVILNTIKEEITNIKKNTEQKKVEGDTDNDGVAENLFADSGDPDKQHQKSTADVSIRDGEKGEEKKGDSSEPWWKKLFGFLKDPKGALLSTLGALKDGVVGLAKIGFDIGKFFLWTLPKTAFYTIPKWFLTTAMPTTWALLGKGLGNIGRFLKGNAGTLLTIAGAGLATYEGIKALRALRDKDSNITRDTSRDAGTHMDTAKNTHMNTYRAGKLLTYTQQAAELNKRVKNSERLVQSAKNMKELRKAGEGLKRAREQSKAFHQVNAKAFRFTKGGANILPNIADEGSGFAKLIQKCKLDKFLKACAGKWESIKDVAKSFVEGLKKCKVAGAIGRYLKDFFGVASKVKPGVWVKYLRFFTFLKGLVKVVMVPINYVMEPAMMAIDGYMRSEIMKAAAETGDTSLIDEYNEANKFGFGRLLGAVFSGGLTEVYNLSATAMSQHAAEKIESAKAESGAIDVKIAQKKATFAAAKKASAAGDKRRAQQLRNMESALDAMEDKVEADSSWYNSSSSTRKAERMNKVDNCKKWIRQMDKLLRDNKLIHPSIPPELYDVMVVNFTERKALHPAQDKQKGWGYQINQFIELLAKVKSYIELVNLFTRTLPSDKLMNPAAREYVVSYLKSKGIKLEQILDYAKKAEQEVKAQAVQTIKQQPLPPKPVLRVKKQDRFATLDKAFTLKNKVEDVYENAHAVFEEVASKKWPENGVYEVGNAIFVVLAVKEDENVPGLTGDLLEATCMLRTDAYLKDRYKGLPKQLQCNSTRHIVDENSPVGYPTDLDGYYVMVTVFKKEEIYSLIKKPTNQSSAVTPKPTPVKESTTARKEKEAVEAAKTSKQEPEPKALPPKKEDKTKMAKEGDITAEEDYGTEVLDDGTNKVVLPYKNETVDQYKKRLEALQKTSKKYISYADERAKALIDQQKAEDAKKKAQEEAERKAKEKKDTTVKPMPAALPVVPVTAAPKPAPPVVPTDTATKVGPRRSVAETMASTAVKQQQQYPTEMLDYFRARSQFNPTDPQAMLQLMMALNENMTKVAGEIAKGNEIAAQNGESANANAKLIANSQQAAANTTVNAINVNGKRNTTISSNNSYSPVGLAQGAAQ